MASLNPHFNGVSPVDLHRIYGVNCYQNALGIPHIMFHFNREAENIIYHALFPGHMAEIAFTKKGTLPLSVLPPCDVKQMTIDGCIEDGLKDLGMKPLSDLPTLPEKEKLIAMLFSFDQSDFHFLAYDKKSGTWKGKFPFQEEREYTSFPENGMGTYLPTRFFAVPVHVKPHAELSGDHYCYPDGTTLTLVKEDGHIPFGNTMHRERKGFRLLYNQQLYPAPDLSFANS